MRIVYNTAVDKLKSGAEKLGLSLTQGQLEQFEVYYRELVDWNQRVNLTAITDYEEVQIKHFLDSLTVVMAMSQPVVGKGLRIIDVGTGAGFPGVPLKILFPDIKLSMLEATARKTVFLNYIKEKLGLKDIKIITGRAEEAAQMEQYRESFDTVLSRSVAALATLAELTLPFCKTGGFCVCQKKKDIKKELADAKTAISILGGSLREVKIIDLPEFLDERCLVIIDKISTTPDKYPRRPGMPAKRPIV